MEMTRISTVQTLSDLQPLISASSREKMSHCSSKRWTLGVFTDQTKHNAKPSIESDDPSLRDSNQDKSVSTP